MQEVKTITAPARKSANDNYIQCNGTENYYKYSYGHILTDGAVLLATDYQCYWLMDIIVSYQFKPKFKAEGFQVWKLNRIGKGDKFKVTAEDGNGNKLVTQEIPFSDFKDDEVTLWLVSKVIMLPSEY